MDQQVASSFLDELEKIAKEKRAIDPLGLVGLTAAAKIMAANAISRYGMNLPPVRRVAGIIMGAGLRAGASGRPQVSRPLREIVAVTVDPTLVKAYEASFDVGKALGTNTLKDISKLLKSLGENPSPRAIASGFGAKPTTTHAIEKATEAVTRNPYFKILQEVELKPSPIIDYLHTPMSEVVSDVARVARGLTPSGKVRNALEAIEETPEIILASGKAL